MAAAASAWMSSVNAVVAVTATPSAPAPAGVADGGVWAVNAWVRESATGATGETGTPVAAWPPGSGAGMGADGIEGNGAGIDVVS